MGDVYTHGHHASVLRSHAWRTAENSAAYLLPSLQPGMRLLDVGCGPGTITLDLAKRIAPGEVVGIDSSADIIEQAEERRTAAATQHVRFQTADVYGLPFASASFDVAHAHQVLQHLSDPVAALREMRRVTRPGGIVAARDSVYSSKCWAPRDPLLDRWLELYHQVTRANRAEDDAGVFLLGWAKKAGFEDVATSSSTWTFADPDSRVWWGGLWAERVVSSTFADQALAYGLSSRAELDAISAAWRRWASAPDGVFLVVHGEILARVE